jgi:DNA polymerase delta subunit 1
MDGGAPSIRLFGVNEHGNSVMCHVTGFLPYFYIPAPIGFQRQHLQPLQLALEKVVTRGQPAIHHIEISMKESIWGFNGNQKTPFLKIILHDAKLVPRARAAFEQGEVQLLDLFQAPSLTFESNIAFLLRFMIDTKVPPPRKN